jgi:phosphoglycolate phosphatase
MSYFPPMLFPMSRELDNINSIIFDFDYTLVESSSASVECISYALTQMCLSVPSPELIRKTIGLSLEDTLKALVGIDDPDAAKEFRRLFIIRADEVMLGMMVFLDGVKQVLTDLDRRGLALGIVSNKYRYRIEAFFKRENLQELIDVIIGFEDTPEPKPNPAGLLIAMNKLGGSPVHTIYIGDSLIDAETASRAGLAFIATLTGVTSRLDFQSHSPCRILNNLQELPRLLS